VRKMAVLLRDGDPAAEKTPLQEEREGARWKLGHWPSDQDKQFGRGFLSPGRKEGRLVRGWGEGHLNDSAPVPLKSLQRKRETA